MVQSESLTAMDRHIGERLRAGRHARRMGQRDLGEKMGCSPAQIQKFEAGINRMSGGRIWLACQALRVTVGYFFDGLSGEGDQAGPRKAEAELLALVQDWSEDRIKWLVKGLKATTAENKDAAE